MNQVTIEEEKTKNHMHMRMEKKCLGNKGLPIEQN
jgi:hypothetical protein